MAYSPTTVDAKELIGLSAHVYGDASSVPAGWVVIDSRTDSISGLKSVAYQNVLDPLRIAVAIAGTQFTNGGTLDTDGTVLGNNFPQRFSDQLREFLDTAPTALSNLQLAYNYKSGTLDTRDNSGSPGGDDGTIACPSTAGR